MRAEEGTRPRTAKLLEDFQSFVSVLVVHHEDQVDGDDLCLRINNVVQKFDRQICTFKGFNVALVARSRQQGLEPSYSASFVVNDHYDFALLRELFLFDDQQSRLLLCCFNLRQHVQYLFRSLVSLRMTGSYWLYWCLFALDLAFVRLDRCAIFLYYLVLGHFLYDQVRVLSGFTCLTLFQ